MRHGKFAAGMLFLSAIAFAAAPLARAEEHSREEIEEVQHGKYLVDRVTLCGDCHTPHTPDGGDIPGKYLAGSKLGFGPPKPGRPERAPALTGLPKWHDDDAVRFLETGKTPKGKYARPPMPQYRLSHEDAVAVVKYLKSLPPPATAEEEEEHEDRDD
jgi:mono/diheme cytochrome c family protein